MQVPCTTLHDVINYLVEKTDRVLIPLILEEAYEKNICMYEHFTLSFTSSLFLSFLSMHFVFT